MNVAESKMGQCILLPFLRLCALFSGARQAELVAFLDPMLTVYIRLIAELGRANFIDCPRGGEGVTQGNNR